MVLKVIALYFLEEKIKAERRDEGIEPIRQIMRDGKIYNNTIK
jgi:hypothetical protein